MARSKSEMVELMDELVSFENFLSEIRPGQTPYFVRYIDRMKYNLKTCVILDGLQKENVEITLQRDWSEAKNTFLAIPGYYFDDVNELDKENTFTFFNYVQTIDTYVKKENEQI